MRRKKRQVSLCALTRLVGLYVIPQFAKTFANEHILLFAAEIIGGALIRKTSETLDARFFALSALPDDLMWHHQIRIQDALGGIGGGVVRVQHLTNDVPAQSRADLYRLRDESDLTPAEFFRQHVFPRGAEITELE